MKKMLWILIGLYHVAAVGLAREGLADSSVLQADLAFHFVCKERDRSALEADIDSFLGQQGFKVLNQGRIRREHGVFFPELKIVALDGARRLINITAMPPSQGRYALGLTTPPPTNRVPQLEDALLGFASKTLGCEVRQVIRGDNAADASEIYDNQIKRVENWFSQAERLRGEQRL